MSSRLASLELSDSSDDDDSVISVPTRARNPSGPSAGTAGTSVLPSPLFGTPRSHLSDSTTGGGGKAFVQLFLCYRAIKVCRGYVINSEEGIRFCCKLASECTIMKHQVTKAVLQDGSLYVKGLRSDQGAYLEPSLPLTSVPEIERVDLPSFLERKNTRPLWLAFFLSCESAALATTVLSQDSSSRPSPMRQAPTPRLDTFTQAESNLRTPRGLRINTFASDDTPFESIGNASPGVAYEEMLDLNTNFLGDNEDADSVELAFLEALQEEWPKIRRNFGALSRDLASLGSESRVLRTDVRSGFQDINEFIEEMGIQVQLLNTRLGADGPASDYANTTVWEALEKLQHMATLESATRLKVSMDNLKV
jgi:hypothetical protein